MKKQPSSFALQTPTCLKDSLYAQNSCSAAPLPHLWCCSHLDLTSGSFPPALELLSGDLLTLLSSHLHSPWQWYQILHCHQTARTPFPLNCTPTGGHQPGFPFKSPLSPLDLSTATSWPLKPTLLPSVPSPSTSYHQCSSRFARTPPSTQTSTLPSCLPCFLGVVTD